MVTDGLGNGREIYIEADGGLTTHGVVGTIVEHDVDVVLRSFLGDDGHASHVHNGGSIPVEAPDPAVLFFQSYAQGNLRSVTHGTDSQEISFMTFILCSAILKEFTGDHTSSRYDHILFTKSTCYYLNGVFSR